jgi:hypothetical protein
MDSQTINGNNPNSNNWNLLHIVFCIFLALKLSRSGEVAEWSWWLVTSPLWAPMVVVGMVLILYFVASAINKFIDKL